MSSHRLSVVVSSYNQPGSLRLTLVGFRAQTDTDFELLIADDGSTADVPEVVEEFAASAPFPVRFFTQPHKGFRKARILNDAVVACRGDQILFCDGDCVPLRDFVAIHRAHYQPGTFCTGGRVMLGPEESRRLTPEMVTAGAHERLLTPLRRLPLYYAHVKNVFYRLVGKRSKPRILGCNWSVDRHALMAIDGFDEVYDQMSGEDSDARNRLRNWGARGISLWHKAFVLHLDHSLDAHPHGGGTRLPKDRVVYEAGRRRIKPFVGISSRAAAKQGEG